MFAAADSVAATAGAAEGEKEEEVLELIPARSCCWLEREEEVLLSFAVAAYPAKQWLNQLVLPRLWRSSLRSSRSPTLGPSFAGMSSNSKTQPRRVFFSQGAPPPPPQHQAHNSKSTGQDRAYRVLLIIKDANLL